jgi:fucose 4-O-acetylase-like acetyltransferase
LGGVSSNYFYVNDYFENTDIFQTGIFVGFRMPLFFFLSGIFFRQRKFAEFLKKRFHTLIVPFIFFYIIAVLCVAVKYYLLAPALNIDMKPFYEYVFAVIGLFQLHPQSPPTGINTPLWFLIALFMMQIIHYCAVKLVNKKWLLIFFALALYEISYILRMHFITGLFYIEVVCGGYIFYLFGSLVGPQLLKIVENKVSAQRMMMFSLLIMILFSLLQISDGIIGGLKFILGALSFITVVFVFFRYTKNFKIINSLKFWGQYSLEVLVTHILIMPSVIRIITRIFREEFFMNQEIYLWLCVVSAFVICVLIEIPVIKFCNRYLPQFLGKKPLTIPRWSKKNVGLVKLDDESENKQEAG